MRAKAAWRQFLFGVGNIALSEAGIKGRKKQESLKEGDSEFVQ